MTFLPVPAEPEESAPGSHLDDETRARIARVADSFQNFQLSLGIGTDNALSASEYGLNPITRNRVELEWVHRGSWLGGVAVDLVADDMTRGGIDLKTTLKPAHEEKIQRALVRLGIWNAINDTVKWSRLYGGALAVMMIDGQDPATPLRKRTVGRGQFKGLLVFDRWMLEPSFGKLVHELGPSYGLPEYYKVAADSVGVPRMSIHHSRCLRLEGIRLPYWQRMQENMWGLSVFERLWDRMIAFDSATTGAAQLIHRMCYRIYKVKNLRGLAASGGRALEGLVKYVDMMRRFQSNEGITLLDSEDDFIPQAINVQSGISDALVQFSQQLSGALQIPLVRLFGQSPSGLNSTGESDLRTYYDGITQQQERHMRVPLTSILEVIARSEGIDLKGHDIDFDFNSLWEMTEDQKSAISQRDVATILDAQERGAIDHPTALKEMRQLSRMTGRFTNISDEMIKEAEAAPPPNPMDMFGGGQPGQPGQPQPAPGGQPPQGAPQPGQQAQPGKPAEGQGEDSAAPARPPLDVAKELMDRINNPGPLDEANKLLARINGRG